MPLEISEIDIRVAMDQPGAPRAEQVPVESHSGMAALSAQQMQQIVQSCVQDVLHTLRMLEVR